MILSIYTMAVYKMSVAYIHDRFVLINLGQQVQKISVVCRVFYKFIQLLDST